jgi:hypothetical protein
MNSVLYAHSGSDSRCIGGSEDPYYAGGYSFRNRKRHAKALDSESASKACQKADTFFNQNGQQYDISSMDDDQVHELIALAQNGTATVTSLRGFRPSRPWRRVNKGIVRGRVEKGGSGEGVDEGAW